MKYNPETVSFDKLSRSKTRDGFKYSSRKATAYDTLHMGINFSENSFNINTQIINNTAEEIIICANYNSNPTIIPPTISLIKDSRGVYIQILYSVREFDSKTNRERYIPKITEIEITEQTLRSSMVFIEEIDSYIAFKSCYHVVRDQIRDDTISLSTSDSRIVNVDSIKADPSLIYDKYKIVTTNFIDRHDRIRIYTGNKDRIESMILSLWDNYFIPSMYDRVIYDPSLKDTFVVSLNRGHDENDIRYTFDELDEYGTIYVDHNEKETVLGNFCGMVIFSNKNELVKYFHKRKSDQRYESENRYLAEHSGNIRLQMTLEERDASIKLLEASITAIMDKNNDLIKMNKDLSDSKKYLEKQNDELVSAGHIYRSAEVIVKKLQVDERKVENDLYDMVSKERINNANTKASVFKNWGDIFKTVLSIITTVITVLPALIVGISKLHKTLKPA